MVDMVFLVFNWVFVSTTGLESFQIFSFRGHLVTLSGLCSERHKHEASQSVIKYLLSAQHCHTQVATWRHFATKKTFAKSPFSCARFG